MKKYFYPVLAAGMLFATSCSQDQELVDVTKGEGQMVTFKVEIPSTESRAIKVGDKEVEIGKGNMATRLIYAQYEDGKPEKLLVTGIVNDDEDDNKGEFTVNLTMANNISYDVLFMAYNPENNIFGISPDVNDAAAARNVNLQALTIKPELFANQEAYDAFVGLLDGANIKDENKIVSLKRPFAQVNAVTTKADLDAAKDIDIDVTYSSLSIKNVPTTYNVLLGEATGATDVYTDFESEVVLKNKDTQTYETFATDQYYLLTAYVLAGDNEYSDASTHDAKLKFYRGTEGDECVSTLEISSLPIQRNHRTNVMGHLLTKTEEYIVKIDNKFGRDNIVNVWNGAIEEVQEKEGVYEITNASQLAWVAEQVNGGNTFSSKTVKLINDIDLNLGVNENGERISNKPIGQRDITLSAEDYKAFKGTFDGNGKTISGYYQNGWDLGYEFGQYGAIGLFARVEDATIKNLTVEDFELRVEGGNVAAVVGNAKGNCTFENITVKNGTVCSYNNGAAGIVAWPEAGEYTFKNIVLEEDFTVAAFWGTYDASLGGVIAEAYTDSKYHFEDIEINCRLDAYNDVCANYQWWAYRYSGMIIGNVDATKNDNGRSIPNPEACNITCTNVVVNYGDWMNYHYCESSTYGTPSYADSGEWKFKRIEPGYSYEGVDHTQCDHGEDESHYVVIPFDQLFGGNARGVYGLAEYEGVTVNYPKSYVKEVSSQQGLQEAIEKGLSVILSQDVNMEAVALTLDKGITIDLNGKTLTTPGKNGGFHMKHADACIKNGKIVYTGSNAAIKVWQASSIENVSIERGEQTGNFNAIVIQSGSETYIDEIKDVTIIGATNGIETYNCGNTGRAKKVVDYMENVKIDAADTGIILSAPIGTAKECEIKGGKIGINMHLKGEFTVEITLEDCDVTGGLAGIWAHDEVNIPNTKNCSLTLTYDAATTINKGTNGDLVWEFEDECQSVVTLNKPE